MFVFVVVFTILIATQLSPLYAKEQAPRFSQTNNNAFQRPQPGEIVFGQSAFLSGHHGLYGRTIKNAIECYFKFVNCKGGIDGKQLRLISLNDEGSPKKFLENIKLLKKYGVSMFIGCTNTPSILAVLPMIKNGEISMFFPWAGHEKFRDPKLKNMINGLGFLTPQLDAIVKELVYARRITKVALFYSGELFSIELAQELTKLLKKYNIVPLAAYSYNPFTVNIQRPAQKLITIEPEVIICLGTSMPTIQLIDYFFEKGYYGVNFIGIDSTLFVSRILKRRGISFTFSASVPDPVNNTLPLVKEYQVNMDHYYPDETYNILSLAYYLSAAIVTYAIKKCEGFITPKVIINNIEKMHNTSIGGYKINFDTSDRHAFGKNIILIKG
jgi:ABC-type branched-subunit amino acid transport system substrate-binding protein